MTELEKEVKKNLIKYCHDEVDCEEYIMYFKDITMGELDLLFIRTDKDSYPEIYVCDHDDLGGHFIGLKELDAATMLQVLNQMNIKKEKIAQPIQEIRELFDKGYDVPAHFAVPSIKDYILDKVKGSETCYIGQVGLSGDEDDTYLSVFFPCKKDPSFSYDTPLSKLSENELGCVLRNMKKS